MRTITRRLDISQWREYRLCMAKPSIPELQRAIQISEQIQQLEAELASLLNWSSSGKPSDRFSKRGRRREVREIGPVDKLSPTAEEVRSKKKRKISAEAKAKIAAAQRARWAKQKSSAGPVTAVVMEPRK